MAQRAGAAGSAILQERRDVEDGVDEALVRPRGSSRSSLRVPTRPSNCVRAAPPIIVAAVRV